MEELQLALLYLKNEGTTFFSYQVNSLLTTLYLRPKEAMELFSTLIITHSDSI